MRGQRLSNGLKAALLAFCTMTLLATNAYAAAWKVLHNGTENGGEQPCARVIFDTAGNLYGTFSTGGAHGLGTVFELTPAADGSWTEKVLHSFNGKDGASPYAGLVFDAAGNLYGTTEYGGPEGYGSAFELTPTAGGAWKYSVVHTFGYGIDGDYPMASLIFDAAGNLYGTTYSGGRFKDGTVFELSPKAGGGWTERILHSFSPKGTDGILPQGGAGVIFDAAGNLYGTTGLGGDYGGGTVFELSPDASGGWTEKVLYSFGDGTDGLYPTGSLVLDATGNIYGITNFGSDGGGGTVFELTPNAGGGWTDTVLYGFSNQGDGGSPLAGLVFDASGNLYGTTEEGGSNNSCFEGCGTVFELSPSAGVWTEKVYSFNGKDGESIFSSVTLDAAGNIYGTAHNGGASDQGTVFEITP
jgi:uncharacterized repeat protein (TIGR03803 family)